MPRPRFTRFTRLYPCLEQIKGHLVLATFIGTILSRESGEEKPGAPT
jgi:hypothetical protein